MNIYEKLIAIQTELKAPKTQFNSFGKYNYRNCEDILEAVKPICRKYNTVSFLSDEIIYVEGRHYVKATVTIVNCEMPEESISISACAREEDEKKGMDGSQVTGASSSYARKYALNGLFDIDDTKDSDTTNLGGNATEKKPKPAPNGDSKPTLEQAQNYVLQNGKFAGMKLSECPEFYLKLCSEKCKGQIKEFADLLLQDIETKKQDVFAEIDKDDDLPFKRV